MIEKLCNKCIKILVGVSPPNLFLEKSQMAASCRGLQKPLSYTDSSFPVVFI